MASLVTLIYHTAYSLKSLELGFLSMITQGAENQDCEYGKPKGIQVYTPNLIVI